VKSIGGEQAGAIVDPGVVDVVTHAWIETLPGPFDPTRTWEEAGGDSLASLHLLLALEKALCRKLSFDAIAPDMTAADMARSVVTLRAVRLPTQVPSVFLLPGILGDEPRLADFRRSFGDRLRFELIEHPGLDQPAAILEDVSATALLAAQEIQRRQPHGEVLLAGFSFGGCVAFEVAHHLRAAQRVVAWIAILDTAFGSPYRWNRFLRPAVLLAGRIGASDRRRRALLGLVHRFQPNRSAWLRRVLQKYFRKRAINRWNPKPLPVPALLATSHPDEPAKRQRWNALCPGIRVVQLPGHHRALFQSPSIELLTPAFEMAAHAARADRRA
jgi:thioesterase domain-containing protein